MNRAKELKNELGSDYSFVKFYDEKEIIELQKSIPKNYSETVVASLTAGCLKLEVFLYRAGGKLLLGYDVLVRENINDNEWICYDNLDETVYLTEKDMVEVLERFMQQNELDYRSCSFEVLEGKVADTENKS